MYFNRFSQELPCTWCLFWWGGSGPCSWRSHEPSLCYIHRCQALETKVILSNITEDWERWCHLKQLNVKMSGQENRANILQSLRQAWLTKHDVILGVSMHVVLVNIRWEDLDIAASTVDLLLMLDGELDDKRLSLIAKGLKAGWDGIKACILAGPDTCNSVDENVSCCYLFIL